MSQLVRRAAFVGASVPVLAIAFALSLQRAQPLGARTADGTTHSTATAEEPSSRWLLGIKAKHKQFFDTPTANGGVPLVHVMNYYDTYNKAFGVKDADINAVLTFYGATTFYGLDDAAWEKYRLGEFLETNDPDTGRPAIKNPWRAEPQILGLTLPQAGIEALHRRGATFILCNNALGIFSDLLAAKRGLDRNEVYADLRKHILPQVQLVPGMVVAVEQAARAGMSYHRQ
jgi:hypothetical protein